MTNLTKSSNFDNNATIDGIKIENIFTSTSALAYGSDDTDAAGAAQHSKTTKKKTWKSFAIVAIATFAVAFGWFALSNMKHNFVQVQEQEIEGKRRNLATKSSKAPKRRDLATKSSKAPKRRNLATKSSKAPKRK